jgi:DNA-binding transcriptional LysR family regulator
MQNGESLCISMQQKLCVNNYAALRHLVLAGAGYAKLPSYLVAQDVCEGKLLRVLADYTLPQTTLFLLTPPLRPQPARVRALMEFIRDWLSVHPVSGRQVRGPATPSSV